MSEAKGREPMTAENQAASTPIVLTLYGGTPFVIEPVTRVFFSQSFAKCGATDGSATADMAGKRRVLMSLPRVRWLERPEAG